MENSQDCQSSIFLQKRRDFLKTLSVAGGSILMSPLYSSCKGEYKSDLYNNFLHPSSEAKPFFRWWWNGNRLSKEEISRELRLMKNAGIGGIEINPIAMPEQAENLVEEEIAWLGDQWIAYLQYTIKEAKKLGMISDLIVGTGWPFGGEFLEAEDTIQGLKVNVIPVEGPLKKKIPIQRPEDNTNFRIKKVVLFPLKINNLDDGIEVSFEENTTSISLQVPKGKFDLCIVTWQNNFRSVLHGAPGGAGPVLDHFNKNAVEKYLNHMSDRIKQVTGKTTFEGIRAMFCDSIELNGANWTHGLETIFKDRRGYDIQPYLPLLLRSDIQVEVEFEDELKRARYDFSLTLAEIFYENFIIPFHNWCHKNGSLSRYQAYGHPWLYTDLIDGYLVPDIPEGDQWLFNGGWQPYADVNEIRYAIWNKYASSAGHLASRKIISSEAMTNTSGVFKASLKYIKQATDLNIVTGINHLVLHGFNYSPPEAGFPGWVRYGCYFNEHNPWWQYMPNWSDYSSRISQIFQDSSPISQVAILGPTPDIWSNSGLDRNPFNMEPWYLHSIWQALNHIGFSSDYVNCNLVKNAYLEGGKIIIGPMKYDILLICDVETIDAVAALKIDELTQQGGRILIIGKKPTRSPKMVGALKNDGIVKKSIENAFSAGILIAPSPEKELQKSPELLMNWTDHIMKNCGLSPNVAFLNPNPQLFQIQHKNGNTHILFMVNVDRKKDFNSEFTFGGNEKYAVRWIPETGEKIKLNLNENGQINLSLRPLESILIISDPLEQLDELRTIDEPNLVKSFEITGSWQVALMDMDKKSTTITLDKLQLISKLSGFENFSGEILYEIQFEVENMNYSIISIDEVYETAELKLNGENLGLSWWGNNQFILKDHLRKGKNRLEIKVTTLLANYCSSLKSNKTALYWTSRYRYKSPVKCGLSGKVYLK